MSATDPSRQILAASLRLSRRLQDEPALLNILHRSHWKCLATSYSAVIQAVAVLLDRACSSLEPLEQETMCQRLHRPLHALHQAVEEGKRCMQESTLPISSSEVSLHSWLVEKALKTCMNTDVVDVHLHRLLWVSSVVREQIMRSAPIDGMESLLSEETRELIEIWEHVDAQDDFLRAASLLNRIMTEVTGEPRELASFILQKLSYFKHRIAGISDLPPFLWVESKNVTRNPEAIGMGAFGVLHEAAWLGGRFAVKDYFYVEDNLLFAKEAMIQAQVCHPNVTPLVCCTRNPSMRKCSLVMELMQQDLRVLLMQRVEAGMDPPFPLLISLDLMLQIAQGMEYLHSDSLRVIHRNLKSSSILVRFSRGSDAKYDVSPHVHLKIAGFSMSKTKVASSRYTTRPIGTTQWRAPEVFEVNLEDEVDVATTKYTNKVDVYSFGMVCYEILSGKLPFEGRQIGRRVIAGERPMLPEYYPLALSSYIRLCWHAEPTMRPTFTQICRMLRYFKACVLLEDHFHASKYHKWLWHPLSRATCARIDDMILGAFPQPHVLIIPLEMYCCRVVLQQFGDKTGGLMIANDGGKSSPDDIIKTSKKITRSWWKSWWKSTQHANSIDLQHVLIKSEIQDAPGSVAEFGYEELRMATNNFSSMLGNSRSGQVFSGMLADGRQIAVKIARQQGQNDFWRNLVIAQGIADKLKHPNIVPLYGCCRDRGDLLLVYKYMPNGNLGEHIHGGEEVPVFGWQQRFKALCEMAAALLYLHQDCGMRIVHGHVKAANVLLDAEWNAHLGGCGLAVLSGDEEQLSEDGVAGTGGYRPRSKIVSHATDIYSLGVMMLEIVMGRWSMGKTVVEWALGFYKKGEVMQAADARLEGHFNRREMELVLKLGVDCTNERPEERPSMEKVTRILSGVLQPPFPA